MDFAQPELSSLPKSSVQLEPVPWRNGLVIWLVVTGTFFSNGSYCKMQWVYCLVVTGTMDFWMTFHSEKGMECHHPNWRNPSCFRGVGIPPISDERIQKLLKYWIQLGCGKSEFWLENMLLSDWKIAEILDLNDLNGIYIGIDMGFKHQNTGWS